MDGITYINTLGFKVFSDNLNKIPITDCNILMTISPNSYGISTRDTDFKYALKQSEFLVLDGVYFGLASILLNKKIIKTNQAPTVFEFFMNSLCFLVFIKV